MRKPYNDILFVFFEYCDCTENVSFMHERLVDNIPRVVEEIGAVDLQFGHDILSSFESAIFCVCNLL